MGRCRGLKCRRCICCGLQETGTAYSYHTSKLHWLFSLFSSGANGHAPCCGHIRTGCNVPWWEHLVPPPAPFICFFKVFLPIFRCAILITSLRKRNCNPHIKTQVQRGKISTKQWWLREKQGQIMKGEVGKGQAGENLGRKKMGPCSASHCGVSVNTRAENNRAGCYFDVVWYDRSCCRFDPVFLECDVRTLFCYSELGQKRLA